MPCWILVPWPGIEPVPPALEVQSPNYWTAQEIHRLLHPWSSSCLTCWLGLLLLFASNQKLPSHSCYFKVSWDFWRLYSELGIGFATKMFWSGLYVSHIHKCTQEQLWVTCFPLQLHATSILKKLQIKPQFSSVQLLSRVWLFETPCIAATRPPCPSPTPGVHSDSCPLSRWCHPAISSSAVPFSSCPQSLPASESFPMSQLQVKKNC